MTERDQTLPSTFAELDGVQPTGDDACRRCGNPATHSVTVSVSKIVWRGAHVRNKKSKLCEPCAVQVFVPIERALR